jgi:hypothetical protein
VNWKEVGAFQDVSHRSSRCKPGDLNLGVTTMAVHKRVSGACRERGISKSPPSADDFAGQDHTQEQKEEGEWVARTAYISPA